MKTIYSKLPSSEALHIINHITSKSLNRNVLLHRLVSGDCITWGNLMSLDSSLDAEMLYLFINGICKNTMYMICEEGINQAIQDATELLKKF